MKVLHTGTFDVNAGSPAIKANRIESVDVAKGLFMFFVILSHSGYVPAIYNNIYSPFFLSGYFLLSGFLMINKIDNIDFSQKTLNILTSILLPYILYWVISYTVEQVLKCNFNFATQLFYDILAGKKLWFISALFVSEIFTILYLFLTKKYQKIGIYLFPLISLLIYFMLPDIDYIWYFKTSFLASFYLGLGMILKIHSSSFLSIIKNNTIGVVMLILFIGCVVLQTIYIRQGGAFHDGFINMPFFIAESLIAICSMLFLCSKITKYNKVLIFMGQSSLLLYFFQNQALRISKLLGAKLSIDNPSYWYSILTVIFVVAILYLPIIFVQRFLPAMAGKYRIKLNKDI